MNYYYLAASLPLLAIDQPPALSPERFRVLCAEHLSPGDLAAVDALVSTPADGCPSPFVRTWRRRDTILRNAIATARAARLKTDATPHLREPDAFDAQTTHTVHEAFQKTDPLERELALDRYRWAMADEIAGFNPFSAETLLAYAIHLQIAGRWAGMSEQEGGKKIDELAGRPAQPTEAAPAA